MVGEGLRNAVRVAPAARLVFTLHLGTAGGLALGGGTMGRAYRVSCRSEVMLGDGPRVRSVPRK